MNEDESPEDWERRLAQLKAERDRWRDVAEKYHKKEMERREKNQKDRDERRELAEYLRYYSRSLLGIGSLGLFISAVSLTLLLIGVPDTYSSVVSRFGGAFAVVIALFVLLVRVRIGKGLSKLG